MRTTALVLIALLSGCETEPPPPDYTLRDAYLTGMCRYLVDGVCADNMSETCGASITFDTASDCTTFFRFGLSGCPGYNDALIENATTVQACVAQMDELDCATEDVCDAQGESVLETGPCGDVDTLLDALCPDDEA